MHHLFETLICKIVVPASYEGLNEVFKTFLILLDASFPSESEN